MIKLPLVEAVEKVLSGEIHVYPSVTSILLIDKLLQKGKL